MKKLANLFRGRINRRTFAFGLLFSFLPGVIIDIFLSSFSNQSIILASVRLFILIILGLFIWSLGIKRLHDFGLSGWVMPVVIITAPISLLVLLFIPGEEINKYGERPSKNVKLRDAILNS